MKSQQTWAALAVMVGITACTSINSPTPSNTAGTMATKTPPPNHEPVIKSLTAHRFSGDRVTLWVQASDQDCDSLKATWTATEGLLSSTVGTSVDLTSTATRSTPFVSTVLVTVADGRGGTAQGSLNVQYGADGVPTLPVEATASQPTPEPCSTPTPEPTPQPTGNTQNGTGNGSTSNQGGDVPITQQGYATVSGVAFFKKYDGYTFLGNFAIPSTTITFAEHSFSGGDGPSVTAVTDSGGKYSVRLKTLVEYAIYGAKGPHGEIPAQTQYITLTGDKTLNIEYWSFN